MFVQVIEGRITDRDGLRRQLEAWNAELRPDATGFLGSTAGVSRRGEGIIIARFESPAAAEANSRRPEQTEWWAATKATFDGPVRFRNAAEAETFYDYGAPCDQAGFVQVMTARVVDRPRLFALEDSSLDAMAATRPSLIGAIRVWDGETFVEAVYFTNEKEARRDEAAGIPDAVAGAFAEWGSLCEDLRFIDLPDPWLTGGRPAA